MSGWGEKRWTNVHSHGTAYFIYRFKCDVYVIWFNEIVHWFHEIFYFLADWQEFLFYVALTAAEILPQWFELFDFDRSFLYTSWFDHVGFDGIIIVE